MSKFQNNRDGILDNNERAASARKCINLLIDEDEEKMHPKDREFFKAQLSKCTETWYEPTEPQLQWLRDMVSRYCT